MRPRARVNPYPVAGRRLEVLVALIAAEQIGAVPTLQRLCRLVGIQHSYAAQLLDDLRLSGHVDPGDAIATTERGRIFVRDLRLAPPQP